MKINHFGCLAALFCLSLTAPTTAQTTVEKTIEGIKTGQLDSPEKRTADLDSMMKIHLELRTEQLLPIHEINYRYALRTEHEIVKTSYNNWSKYAKLMALQADKDRELEGILTRPQMEKYAANRDAIFWKALKAILF